MWCDNEDQNLNARLESGEDTNSDGVLFPGNPVAYSPDVDVTETEAKLVGKVLTDEKGFADFSLLYGVDYATWIAVQIKAVARVEGTENKTKRYFYLSGASSYYKQEDTTLPWQYSPFGATQDCAVSPHNLI